MFTPTEEAAASVSLSVGGAPPLELTPDSATDGFTHVYAHEVAPGDPQGEAEVVIRLTDRARNAGGPWRAGGIAVDTTAPVLGDLQVAPGPLAAARTSLVVTAFADDVVASARIESSPPLEFPRAILSGDRALWSYLVSPADESRDHVLTARVTDRAGNESAAADAIVRFDTRAPQALQVVVEGSPARAGTLVRASFTASESLAEAPLVSVGGVPMDPDSASDLRYSFSHAASTREGSGVRDVAVRLRDPAGNETQSLLGRVTYDFAAPVLSASDVVVSPATPVGIGAVLTVSATAAEALDSARVEVVPALDLGAPVVSGRTARWSRAVLAADAGGERAFAVFVTDLAGNESNGIAVRASLDTERPVASGATIEGSPAREGTVIAVEFDVSESLPADPVVTVGDAVLAKDEAASGALHYRYTHVASAADGAGAKPVSITVMDAAGNATTALPGQVVEDFKPPVLTRTDVRVAPVSPIGVGANLTIAATADEPIADATAEVAPALALGEAIVSGRTAFWSHLVEASDAAGEHSVAVVLHDAAGNETILDVEGAFTLDTAPPTVLSGAKVEGSPARVGATVEAVFTVSEIPFAPPDVRVGAIAMTLDAASVPPRYIFTHVVSAAEGEGPRNVVVAVRDAAGNASSSTLGQVAYDFTAPRLWPEDATVSPVSPVGIGATLSVSATSDEPLLAAALESTPALDFGGVVLAGRSALWRRTISAGDSGGAYSLAIRIADLAGNEASLSLAQPVVLDTVRATISNANVGGSPARDGSVVSAEFDVSEDLPAPPIATVGGTAMTLDDANSEGRHYIFVHTAAASELSGHKQVEIAATDAAGNITTALPDRVVYDFEPPVVGTGGIAVAPPSPMGLGANLTIAATADEPIGSARIEASPTLPMGDPILSGKTVLWTHIVSAADAPGFHVFSVTLTDLAGNSIRVDVETPFELDTSVPSIVGEPALAGSPAREGARVTVSFIVSEDLPEAPVVRVGAEVLKPDAPEPTARRYSGSHEVMQSEGAGNKAVSAVLVDGAGNTTTVSLGYFAYDFSPPSATSDDIVVAPDSPIGLGRNLTITLTTDELLGPDAEIRVEPPLEMGNPLVSGRSAIWSHVVTATDSPGPLSVQRIVVRDLAGNERTVGRNAAAELDTVAPSVLPSASLKGSPAKVGAIVEAAFDVSETLATAPAVRVGAVEMTIDPSRSTSTHHEYTHAAQAVEGAGAKEVTIVLADTAGNSTTTALGRATYDFEAPVLAAEGMSAVPELAGIGSNLIVTATFTEPLASATFATPTIDFGSAIVSGKTALWSRVVRAGDPEGPIEGGRHGDRSRRKQRGIRVARACGRRQSRARDSRGSLHPAGGACSTRRRYCCAFQGGRGAAVGSRRDRGRHPHGEAVRLGGDGIRIRLRAVPIRHRRSQAGRGDRFRRRRQLDDLDAGPGDVRLHTARCGFRFGGTAACRHRREPDRHGGILGTGTRRHSGSLQRPFVRQRDRGRETGGLEPDRAARRPGRTVLGRVQIRPRHA